jgi:hypothetical protein
MCACQNVRHPTVVQPRPTGERETNVHRSVSVAMCSV